MNKSIIYIILTAFLFGTMEIALKIGGMSFNPIQLTFLRFAIGGLMLLPFSINDLKNRKYHLTKSDILYLFSLGVICICISMALFQVGVMKVNANLASVIISMNPMFTMIFAYFIVHEEFTKKKALVIVLSMIGLVIVANPSKILSGENNILYIMITVIAAVTFGLYTAMGKLRIGKIGGLTQNSFSFLFGSAVLLVILVFNKYPIVEGINTKSLPLVLYLGIFVTGAGYYCYLKAIELAGPSTASIAFFIKPVIAPILAFFVLNEKITLNIVIGVLLIVTSSFINLKKSKSLE